MKIDDLRWVPGRRKDTSPTTFSVAYIRHPDFGEAFVRSRETWFPNYGERTMRRRFVLYAIPINGFENFETDFELALYLIACTPSSEENYYRQHDENAGKIASYVENNDNKGVLDYEHIFAELRDQDK